jgi:dipeptidyl aminopeptidase/acylaminoacyl peptidase
LESLLGGTVDTVPQVYHDRSPINFANCIKAPLLVLQGSEDRVVPPNQSELIVESIKSNPGHAAVEYHLFEGEAHGFKKAENIQACAKLELEFYQRCFK